MKPRIWVLGAGQLGAMLKHAGMPLGLEVCPVDIDETAAPSLEACDWVTAERELWPQTLATQTLAAHGNFVNKDVFGRLADRKTQKELIDSLGIKTAPWRLVADGISAAQLRAELGDKVLLKRRTGGYDGRGQHWLRSAADAVPDDWQGEAIAEQAINFAEEVSLVGVRNRQGECVFYPLTRNLHLDGILYASIAPLARLHALQAQAQQMLGRILTALNYVGVMAMEAFRVGDELLINELAPRVHNSGHWSQAGASISQFEYHLRAIADLATPAPQITGQSVMINLIGTDYQKEWLALPCARTYWYGKEVKPGRKVGHINVCSHEHSEIVTTLKHLEQLLPPQYYSTAIDWCLEELAR